MYIDEWEWDEANEEEIRRHGLNRRMVEQVWLEKPKFRRNKKYRAASHQMIGPDLSGAIWVIFIAQVPGGQGLWRVITGWRASKAQEEWYGRY
ncbi:MAG TPA: hypothetical protein VH599_15250 [Ktedonobacterales bacterium]|jgi:uncharacterized DUF497 family protein